MYGSYIPVQLPCALDPEFQALGPSALNPQIELGHTKVRWRLGKRIGQRHVFLACEGGFESCIVPVGLGAKVREEGFAFRRLYSALANTALNHSSDQAHPTRVVRTAVLKGRILASCSLAFRCKSRLANLAVAFLSCSKLPEIQQLQT